MKLKLEQLGYQYEGAKKAALTNVNAVFSKGTLSAIIWPSGSGKTTLLSLLAALDHPSTGRILLDGQDIAEINADKYRRERVAVIFQSFQLFPLLTALENAACPMELRGIKHTEASTQAERLLRTVGITAEQQARYPTRLSGGEQQRVAIARALASGAQLLLADEPTGNLDEENSRSIVSLLRSLAHNADRCVIVVTHDLAIARGADAAYELRDGTLRLI